MTKSSNWKIISNIIECQAGMMRYSNWVTRDIIESRWDIVIEWQEDILKEKRT